MASVHSLGMLIDLVWKNLPKKASMPAPKFKGNFLHLKGLEKLLREPLDHTGNEPTLDLPIGGTEQDIRLQNNKYMSFEMNMLTCTMFIT